MKEENEKVGLKLNIQKTKTMASGPITSWQIDGETMKTVTSFIFLGSKITVDSDCSHEIKSLAPWKKNCDEPRQLLPEERRARAEGKLRRAGGAGAEASREPGPDRKSVV